MLKSRRSFIRTLGGAGLGVLALPTVSTLDLESIMNFVGLPGANGIIEVTLADLHALSAKSSPFVAFAGVRSTGYLIDPQPLLRAQYALRNIYGRLGLKWAFGSGVGYRDADQCEAHFKTQERTMRSRRFDSFTDVERARSDRDVAYLVGYNTDSNNPDEIAGATQYQAKPAVELRGVEPGIIEAAQAGHKEDYSPTRKEEAQSLTVIEKGTGATREIVYKTPTSEIAYYPSHRLVGSRLGERAVGIVSVRRNNDPEHKYYSELYT